MALKSRRSLRVVVILLALILASGLGFQRAYPGMTGGLLNQLRYSTLEESRNVWIYVSYLLGFLEKLALDTSRGIYDFQLTPDTGLDDFERGRLAFPRGRFREAAALLERHLARKGESEDGLFWLALA